jgi:hypothetical protein
MEGLNSLFSTVLRKACGYQTGKYRTEMFYFVVGKLTLPCNQHPKINAEPKHLYQKIAKNDPNLSVGRVQMPQIDPLGLEKAFRQDAAPTTSLTSKSRLNLNHKIKLR